MRDEPKESLRRGGGGVPSVWLFPVTHTSVLGDAHSRVKAKHFWKKVQKLFLPFRQKLASVRNVGCTFPFFRGASLTKPNYPI